MTGLAIDKGEKKKYKLTSESLSATELNPKTKADSTPSSTFSLEGDSIPELSRKMNVGLARKPIYSHMRTVVLSEEIVKEGMLDFFDFLERNREIEAIFTGKTAKLRFT